VLRQSLIKTAIGLTLGAPWPLIYWYRQGHGALGLTNPHVLASALGAVASVLVSALIASRPAGRLDPAVIMRQE
jgi:hypothetical protein